MKCSELSGSWLKFRAFDLAQVRIDGRLVGNIWRAIPPKMRMPRLACAQSAQKVELSITVFAYGRDNFMRGGTATALSKGIVGDVVVVAAGKAPHALSSWRVAAMPLVQPGRVLQWDGNAAEVTTYQLLQSKNRLPYDSLHGGVWHEGLLKGDERSIDLMDWQRNTTGQGPIFYRCVHASAIAQQ